MDLKEPQRILTEAIETWQPVALVSLYSGGYDSAITTHVLHRLNTHGLPIQVWAIDTQLAADGWHEYVRRVASRFGWNFHIYDNKKGFLEYLEWIITEGCPRSLEMHGRAFHRLKERGFDAILKMNKTKWTDKVLFISGRRRAESENRKDIPEIERIGQSNKIFAAPIIRWTNEQCDYYRLENDLPDNPFYDTVKGSGDCQCNWGLFITYWILRQYSPKLAAGNVAIIDAISRNLRGFGWDEPLAIKDQGRLFDESQTDFRAELSSPFLCEGCSRRKVRAPSHIVEQHYLQAGLF